MDRDKITPEDRLLIQQLKQLTNLELLRVIAIVVMKDSRIRATVLDALLAPDP